MPTAKRLFPVSLPSSEWVQFPAAGYTEQACGVIYRLNSTITNGMPLGGVDTGCLDLDPTGLLGYCTIFNTHVPRRGPMNLPLLGLSCGGRTWMLCDPKARDGEGSAQHSSSGRSFNLWRGKALEKHDRPITPIPTDLELGGVEWAREIHYWGHFPVADLEFETDAPIQVGLRAWSPFLPGDLHASMIPGIVLEVHLSNTSEVDLSGTIATSFPGPTEKEAATDRFAPMKIHDGFRGLETQGEKASYALGAIGREEVRLGGELGLSGPAWSRIDQQLPDWDERKAGSSVAVDFSLPAGAAKTVRFALTWNAPTWNAGGYNWSRADHDFVHMYAKHHTSPGDTAKLLATDHSSLLSRILAWQQVIYTESSLPIWLRESLVNVLHLITEDGLWAQAKPPIPEWVRQEDGLFGMNECPRGCPQIECIPCSFYGNQPLVYFFPELALSTLRGYRGYQFEDGAPPWIFGGCTGSTPPIDFANTTRGYQFATNGISLATMVDRYFLCHDDADFVDEFYPMMKMAMLWTIGLRTTPSYSMGDRVIAMPDPDSDESAKPPREWFEVEEPGWFGMTSHVGGLHLAQLRITQRMAEKAGDLDFAGRCEEWVKAGAESMEERLWAGSYYLNFHDPETGRTSDLVFGYQLDGEWILQQHGLPPVIPDDRVMKTLETIESHNIALSKFGAVNYANPDGSLAKIGGYGTYSFFPPEALMLAMTYMYRGNVDLGLELARKTWHNIVCNRGYTWDMPNIIRGDVDTGERTFGNDYYQDMMLWSLPAAVMGQDFGAPVKQGGLVDRVIRAARTGRA